MNTRVQLQLSVMMFLEYVIWSVWYVTMGPYLGNTLGFSAQEIGYAYNATALAAMISPFFVGMIADRFFPTQKILAFLHILGGFLMYAISTATTFQLFYPLLIAHTLCYMPTLALTNSLAFHQMKDPGTEFPKIRVLGTIGWIVTGWSIDFFLGSTATTTALTFKAGAVVSIFMGLYCFTLPHTPPAAKGQKVTVKDVLGLDALRLMKESSFAIFVIASFLICIPLSFYFSFTPTLLSDMNMSHITTAMTMGQISEIFFLLVMPWFFARLGIKWMLMVGMICWITRYLFFTLGYNSSIMWPLYFGVALHGVCYDFFFVTAYIYVDKKSPENVRAKAQGFIAFVTLGAGMFVGTSLSGLVVERCTFPKVEPVKFQQVADVSTWAKDQYVRWETNNTNVFGRIQSIATNAAPSVVSGTNATPAVASAVIEVYQKAEEGFKPSGTTATVPLTALSKPIRAWDKIWLIPAGGAFIILVLFGLLFRYKEEPAVKK